MVSGMWRRAERHASALRVPHLGCQALEQGTDYRDGIANVYRDGVPYPVEHIHHHGPLVKLFDHNKGQRGVRGKEIIVFPAALSVLASLHQFASGVMEATTPGSADVK
jgi:hypothetical protein